MTDEEALHLVDLALRNTPLSNLQELMLRRVWQGQSYAEIAQGEGYSPEYIKRVGAQLWRSLSTTFGEKVTKSNLRVVLRHYQEHCHKLQGSGLKLADPKDELIGQTAEPQATFRADASAPMLGLNPAPEDWEEAIDTSGFFGRGAELAQLRQWILADHCRLIAVLGLGGVGKTALAAQVAHQVQHHFDRVIWRSLRHAPPLEALLQDLGIGLSPGQGPPTPPSWGRQIAYLMQYLRSHRCLIVLDHGEALLPQGQPLGEYQAGYAAYGELFRQMSQSLHQSCLLITSREQLPGLAHSLVNPPWVRSLRIGGLSLTEAKLFLAAHGWRGGNLLQQKLVNRYQGHPLALKIALTALSDLFNHDIATFLDQQSTVLTSIRQLLNQQFDRLSPLEQQVMYWLYLNHDPVSAPELQADLFPPVSLIQVLEALESLVGRSLIETLPTGFSLSPLVMEYVGDRWTTQIRSELLGKSGLEIGSFLQTYALVNARGEAHLQSVQVQQRLKSISDWLLKRLGNLPQCEAQLRQVLTHLRAVSSGQGYGGDNVINLLGQLKADLSGRDFSTVVGWQADLSAMPLPGGSFTEADLSKCQFTQTYGGIVAIAFHLDGICLATADNEGQVHLWRVSDRQLLQCWQAHPAWAATLAFSANEEILASGGLGDVVFYKFIPWSWGRSPTPQP